MSTAEQALPRPILNRERAADLAARAVVGTLFALLTANLYQDFTRTGHFTGLLLLASESLIVVLTVFRRHASVVDRTAVTRAVTAISVVGPPLLRAGGAAPLLSDAVTSAASAAGLILVVLSKVTLGRSFGIVPANRGVVIRGPYRFVRHPIYVGYVVTHLAFVVAHPTAWNLAFAMVADTALIWRALLEERVLVGDGRYREYCRSVSWHFVPGLY